MATYLRDMSARLRRHKLLSSQFFNLRMKTGYCAYYTCTYSYIINSIKNLAHS